MPVVKVNSKLEGSLLSANEVWGDDSLEIMRDEELRRASLSDLAILLGGLQVKASSYLGLEDRLCGYYWTASSPNNQTFGSSALTVHGDSDETMVGIRCRYVSVRPALSAFETSKISPKHIRNGEEFYGAKTVLYGDFPQSVAENQGELEKLYQTKNLRSTGKVYRFDSTDLRDFDTPYQERVCQEYSYKGKRYIRVKAKVSSIINNVLSNGKKPKEGRIYWVEVEPVEWLKDKSGIWVAKQALLAGMQFNHQKYYDGEFKKTDMYARVQEFIKEIMPDSELYNEIQRFDMDGNRELLIDDSEKKKEEQRNAFEEKKRRILKEKEIKERLKRIEKLKGNTRIEVGKNVPDEKIVKVKDKPIAPIVCER